MLRFVPVVLVLGVLTPSADAQDWRAPAAAAIVAPARGGHPLLAGTADELAALRTALRDGVAPVVARVAAARARLAQPVHFPPRGGQHNQWYQCAPCQLALVTVDPTRHRCPRCGTVYTGPPYDDVVFSRVHGDNLARARDAAWAFALTDEAAFARDAAAILLGYAARYRDYPLHGNAADPSRPMDSAGRLKEQTLSEAAWLVELIAPAVDLIWPALADAERAALGDGLIAPMLTTIGGCRRGRSNWQSWHNAAMFAGGVLLGDADWLRRSILDPQHGFLFQLGAAVSADGMWYENSWGYHLYALRALVAHAEAARRAGIDLWGEGTLARMCALPARYRMGDGRLPRFGDDVGTDPLAARPLAEAAWAATGDRALLALLPAAPSWESVLHGRGDAAAAAADQPASELFAAAGHAILRSDPPAAASAALTFGPFGGFHGHFDKLSFVWHAFGTERGVDPGRAASQAYRLPIHAGWYRATLAHNAVVVDGGSQRGTGGELLAFVQGDGFAAAAARCGDAWPGVDHRRCLVLAERRLIVLDVLRADRIVRCDWLYHDRADAVECATAAGPVPALDLAGSGFATWHGAGRSDGPVAARFVGRRASTELHAAGGSETLVVTGDGPGRSVLDRVPFLLLRRSGAEVWFAAVLEAVAPGHPPLVRGLRAERTGDGIAVELAGAAGERFHWDGGGRVVRGQ